MGNKERKLTDKFLLSLSDNQRRYRINAGQGYTGQVIRRTADSITLKNWRIFHGAVKGFPDTIGWDTVIITPDMVGQKVAVFAADEVKATGDLTGEQRDFRDLLIKMGGRFRVIRE